MNLETYEIQLDTVGQEAVQQTLDALGVKTQSINATEAASSDAATRQTAAASPTSTLDLSRVESLLERIAVATERQQQPVY